MFRQRLVAMSITAFTVITIVSSAAGQSAGAGSQHRRIHLQSGKLFVDDKIVHRGFSVIQDQFRFLYFYVPSRGLFIVSDSQFDGALELGAFDNSTLSFRVDGVDVKIETAARILSDSSAPAWVKFDPSFKLDIKSVMLGYGHKESTPYEWPNQLRENR